MRKLNEVRIIAGKFRGRKIQFLDQPGLRPTPDRVRETLFNWLAPIITEANCLDLFAGSGALGLEALSRGATYATFIDSSLQVISQLKKQLSLLKIENANVFLAEVPHQLPAFDKDFNLIFLDPPFNQGLVARACTWLEEQTWLDKNAYIYIEAEASLYPLPVPNSWKLLRSQKAGQVGYYLFKRNG